MQLSRLTVLSEDEVLAVHRASLDVLENRGVKIMSGRALDLFERAGLPVDRETRVCRFPAETVERCAAAAPETFELWGRGGRTRMTVGGGTPRCASGHNAVFCIDPKTLRRRYATIRDVEEFGIVSEWCRSIDIVGVPLNPMDVPARATLLYAAKALFETTAKPLFFSTESCAVAESLIDMMRAAAGTDDVGARPNAILQLSPSSPLFWQESAADGVLACAAARVPLVILPEPMSGFSAPYSVAGLLTENNAEFLSGLVLAQLASPGTPVLYGSSWTTCDMRTTGAQIASPETSLLRVAGCQMARFYRVPAHTTAPNTDSNAHDGQNAWESALSNFAAMDAGNDIVMNSGMFAGGLTTSLEKLVMDDELNGIVRRMMRGFRADGESCAPEVIRRVGPAGSFLTEEHTLDNLYSDEFYTPVLRAAPKYETWMADGAPTSDALAGRVAAAVLAKGNPADPGPALKEKLAAVIASFEQKYGRG